MSRTHRTVCRCQCAPAAQAAARRLVVEHLPRQDRDRNGQVARRDVDRAAVSRTDGEGSRGRVAVNQRLRADTVFFQQVQGAHQHGRHRSTCHAGSRCGRASARDAPGRSASALIAAAAPPGPGLPIATTSHIALVIACHPPALLRQDVGHRRLPAPDSLATTPRSHRRTDRAQHRQASTRRPSSGAGEPAGETSPTGRYPAISRARSGVCKTRLRRGFGRRLS